MHTHERRRMRLGGGTVFDIANGLFLCCLAIVTLYPFWYVLVGSFLPYSEAIRSTFNLFPKQISFDAYMYVFRSEFIMKGFLISVFITIATVVYQLLLTSMAAYALTKTDLPFRSSIFTFMIITMFMSGGLIPFYMLVKELGFVNNLLVMIIPSAVGVFNLIVIKTFMQSLPVDLEESAYLDGAGFTRMLFTIILPLSGPVLATMGLFIAVGQWNNWMTPTLFIHDKDQWPLAMVLRDILVQNNKKLIEAGAIANKLMLDKTIKNAVMIVSIVPIIAVYPFIQRHFVKGMMIGAVKS